MDAGNRRKETDIRNLIGAGFIVDMDGDNLDMFSVEFHGPEDSLYRGRVWTVVVQLPTDYPKKKPEITFIDRIYHPNISYPDGRVCVDILGESWDSRYELKQVFELFLPQLLREPNPDDPMNPNAATLMKNDRATYEEEVRACCLEYAKPAEDAPEENAGNADQQ